MRAVAGELVRFPPRHAAVKVFDGKLEGLLGELAEEVWKDAG